jgi:hypothetical protein
MFELSTTVSDQVAGRIPGFPSSTSTQTQPFEKVTPMRGKSGTRQTVTAKTGSGKFRPRKTPPAESGKAAAKPREREGGLEFTHRDRVVARLGPIIEIGTGQSAGPLKIMAPKIERVMQFLEEWVQEVIAGTVVESRAFRGLDLAAWYTDQLVAYVHWDRSGKGVVRRVK